MIRKIILFALVFLILAATISIAADSLYDPSWKVTIDSKLSQYRDDFSFGVGKPALDSYDEKDIIKAPQFPGKSILIQSVVEDVALQGDYRADIGLKRSKTWKTTLIANDPAFSGISGTEILTWNLDGIPRNIKLTLIDYGTDPGRTKIVRSIDMKKSSAYSFKVFNGIGPYRYVDIKATRLY